MREQQGTFRALGLPALVMMASASAWACSVPVQSVQPLELPGQAMDRPINHLTAWFFADTPPARHEAVSTVEGANWLDPVVKPVESPVQLVLTLQPKPLVAALNCDEAWSLVASTGPLTSVPIER